MEQLPDEMLAEILARLPPSSLAASRCVSKHWCCIVDDRRLLRAHLLPLRLEALYCISLDIIDQLTYLFARPSAARRIPGGCLDFLEDYQCLEVKDHCNGLLLVYDTVVNPATRQWATLPYAPEPSIDHMLGVAAVWAAAAAYQEKDDGYYPPLSLSIRFYLVYDPIAESPQHFEVFLIPLLMGCRDALLCDDITIDLEEQEWPPSTFRTHVFSSRRWRWEERSWIRQGEPAGTMADMLRSENCYNRKAVYFRGALYVHCQNDAVMRISLSKDHKNTYQMMRLPATRSKLREESATVYLGKSEKGVYCALLQYDSGPQFRVWSLREEEMNGQIHMEWLLKTNISLGPLLTKLSHHHHDSLAPDEWRIIRNHHDYDRAASSAHDAEWNFDNAHEIVLEEAANNAKHWYPIDFLGFHPYKEIVFFSLSWKTISYNLNTSKVQLLGGKAYIPVGIKTYFPYTPCWLTMEELAVDHPSPAT